MTDFDFSKRYKVDGWGGIAWYCIGFEKVPEYTDHNDEDGMVENRDRVVCIMVGDDSKHTFDVDELTPLDDEEYCHECGQIGCTADGR